MNQPPIQHQKLLQDIDRMLEEAPNEAARNEILALRERLNSPELRELARAQATNRERPKGNLALEFHDPLLPGAVTAAGCVIASAICLFAVVSTFGGKAAILGGSPMALWLVAAAAGAISVGFTALSFMRTFSVRVDTEGMLSSANGARWKLLRIGAMQWKDIRSTIERPDRVLEIHAAGAVFDVPMKLVNYPILKNHLDNMVMLYGERR
jgi:hypothetical protein